MVDAINSGNVGSGLSAVTNNSMGKDDFLKMLISQLKNQDPMNPMDGTQFAAQLAQFSSLEQLSNLNSNVKASIDANYLLSQSINNTMSTTMIGKEVKISQDTFKVDNQKEVKIGYELPASAKNVTVNIYNNENVLIKTIKNLPVDEGETKLSWDLTDNGNRKVQNGSYHYEVVAQDASDSKMEINSYLVGTIDSVRFSESGSSIVVNGNEFMLSDILEILKPSDN